MHRADSNEFSAQPPDPLAEADLDSEAARWLAAEIVEWYGAPTNAAEWLPTSVDRSRRT